MDLSCCRMTDFWSSFRAACPGATSAIRRPAGLFPGQASFDAARQGSHSTNPKICSKVSGREPSDAPVDRGGASLEVPKGANRRLRFDCAAAMVVKYVRLVVSSLAACCIKPGGLLRQACRAVASSPMGGSHHGGLHCRYPWHSGRAWDDHQGRCADISKIPSVSGGAYRHVSAIWYHTSGCAHVAGVAELVDALGLGSSGLPVKVRVLSPAPTHAYGYRGFRHPIKPYCKRRNVEHHF